jgi:hypothetical protein
VLEFYNNAQQPIDIAGVTLLNGPALQISDQITQLAKEIQI